MKLLVFFLLILSITGTGCRKLVAVAPPDNLEGTEQVFSHDSIAERTIVGVYAQIMAESNILNGNLTRSASLYSDDVTRASMNERDSGFLQVTLTPTYFPLRELWSKPYQYIFSCNSILEGLRRPNGLTAAMAAQLQGEARFLRAICYFYLTNLFGDVPVIVETDYQASAGRARTAQSIVYDTIIADLVQAAQWLPEAYPGDAIYAARKIRCNKWAATALLSRVWLYRQQWEAAIAAASAVLESGRYLLCDHPDSVFKYSSTETILQLQPPLYTSEAGIFLLPQGNRPAFEPTTGLLGAFEPGDRRQASWAPQNGNYYSLRKYQQLSGPPREYNVLLRLSEMYLIRAEALIRLGRWQEASMDINAVHQRAGLPPVAVTSHEGALLALARERRLEFFAELGHRFLDLKRWMNLPDNNDPLRLIAMDAMRTKLHWSLQKNLWPVPAFEISANSLLVQNPGYQ